MTDQTIVPEGSLFFQFENVESALPDTVVTNQSGTHFHRQDLYTDEAAAACGISSKEEYIQVSLEDATRAGKSPCKRCFEPVLEYFAVLEDAPIELTNGHEPAVVEVDGEISLKPLDKSSDEVPALSTLTEEVMIKGGSSKKMHAPTHRGTLCGRRGGYRTVDLAAVEDHYTPCGDCFAIQED